MSAQVTAHDGVATAALVKPGWRRARLWVLLLAVVIVAAAAVATLSDEPGRPLDPASAHKNGSKALARLLQHYGATLTATHSIDRVRGPGAVVVVTEPNDYSADQLRRLAAGPARLVLVRPGTRAGHAVAPGLEPAGTPGLDDAECSDQGAAAAGSVDFPGDALTYRQGASGMTPCFGGAVLVSSRLAVLGSADLLTNERLADAGVAALAINVITDSRRLTSVTWLLPGADAQGPGPTSIWDLFPGGAYRAFWWLLAVGALTILWRGRRLGGVVAEPLPVVVRSVEVVEGHGRLYARAGARDRAAVALRAATRTRLATRLGLPRGAPVDQVAVAAAAAAGDSPAHVSAVLGGPPPPDDKALLRLAAELDQLESAGGGPKERTTS